MRARAQNILPALLVEKNAAQCLCSSTHRILFVRGDDDGMATPSAVRFLHLPVSTTENTYTKKEKRSESEVNSSR